MGDSRDPGGSTDLQRQGTRLFTVIIAFSSWPPDDCSSSKHHVLIENWGQPEWQKSSPCFSSRKKSFTVALQQTFLYISLAKPDSIATPMCKAFWKSYMCMHIAICYYMFFIGSIVEGEHERRGFKMTVASTTVGHILECSVHAAFSVTTSSSMPQISLSGLVSFLRVNFTIIIFLEISEHSFTKSK